MSNIRIVFSNSSLKGPNKTFLVQNLKFFFLFSQDFLSRKKSRVLTPNMAIVFSKFLPKNTQIRHFWCKS